MTPVINLASYRKKRSTPTVQDLTIHLNGKKAHIAPDTARTFARVIYDCLTHGGQVSNGVFVIRELVCDKFEVDLTALEMGKGECTREQAVMMALGLLGQ